MLFTITVSGIHIPFESERRGKTAVDNVANTMRLVPREHLLLIRRIAVFTPPPRTDGRPPYAGGGSGVGYPRLSFYCFSRTRNHPINRTLLHEVGHIVEAHHGVANWLLRDGSAHLTVLRRNIIISPERRTQGVAEYFADGYSLLLARRANDEVRTAMLATAAFSGVQLPTMPTAWGSPCSEMDPVDTALDEGA